MSRFDRFSLYLDLEKANRSIAIDRNIQTLLALNELQRPLFPNNTTICLC